MIPQVFGSGVLFQIPQADVRRVVEACREPATVMGIAAKLGITHQRATRMLAAAVELRMVQVLPRNEQRRQVYVARESI